MGDMDLAINCLGIAILILTCALIIIYHHFSTSIFLLRMQNIAITGYLEMKYGEDITESLKREKKSTTES